MNNLRYTFAELLNVFFFMQPRFKTIKELATALNKGERTVRGWLTGENMPRDRDIIIQIAQAFSLTPQQTDLLLYAGNESWNAYGTPANVLCDIDLFHYREAQQPRSQEEATATAPVIATLEESWKLVFEDDFANNYRSWGVGIKDDGVCRIRRSIRNGAYTLRLVNRLHDTVFMGGDSACFAPSTYLLSVEARLTEWQSEDDGPALIFEEVSDNCFAVMRIRERTQQVSVVQTRDDGRNGFAVYLNREPAPALRPGEVNRLSIVASGINHWFYVNNALVGHTVLQRLSRSRLDVGAIAGHWHKVTCRFNAFRVYTPNDNQSLLDGVNDFSFLPEEIQ